MRPPGGLEELGTAGQAAWSAHLGRVLGEVAHELVARGRAPVGVVDEGSPLTDVRTIEWPGFPARIAANLGRREAMEASDRRGTDGGAVGRALQEEYLEWRLVSREGNPVGIQMSTELGDYWKVLAAHEPRRTLALAGRCAGEAGEAPAPAIYGIERAEVLAATPQARSLAFGRTMLPVNAQASGGRFSPYNDGRLALCCMVQENNDLAALLKLVLGAARPLLVEDRVSEQDRYPSGGEAIAALEVPAKDGRNSDPLIVERIVRFVTEGLRVGFDDPIGVYIGQIQLHELAQPDGEDVPPEWVELSRGATAVDGRSRAQRLELRLPDDADFSLTDLIVRRSGEGLRFGAQLAALVELCTYVRTGPADGDRA